MGRVLRKYLFLETETYAEPAFLFPHLRSLQVGFRHHSRATINLTSGTVSILRCLFGGAFPLFGGDLFKALGVGWGVGLMAFLTIGICLPLTVIVISLQSPVYIQNKF